MNQYFQWLAACSLLFFLLVYNFRYDAKKNQWVDGEIYDPVHGKIYKSKMWFESENVLRVRGYIGISALGRTMTWKKLS